MKFIVIGLGNFGTVLAERLTILGHDVIGVDEDIHKVDELKDVVKSVICLNPSDKQALLTLPIREADAVFVTIGEDFGVSVYTTALIKQLGSKRLISRALSPLHKTILEAIGVDDTISPERDYGELYATQVDIPQSVGNYLFSGEYHVVEISVPQFLIGQKLSDINFESNYNLRLLSLKRKTHPKGVFLLTKDKDIIVNNFKEESDLKLDNTDTLLLYGKVEDVKKLLNT